MTTKKIRTQELAICALFAAVIAICAQIAIPFASGVPITLQTFGVALTGYFLGMKKGLLSTFVYLLLGAVGLPVFSGFKGGLATLVGKTGGFMVGFLLLVLASGLGARFKNLFFAWIAALPGLMLCHVLGVTWYTYLAAISLGSAFSLVSLPFLVKDVISVFLAAAMAALLKKRMNQIGK